DHVQARRVALDQELCAADQESRGRNRRKHHPSSLSQQEITDDRYEVKRPGHDQQGSREAEPPTDRFQVRAEARSKGRWGGWLWGASLHPDSHDSKRALRV